MGKYIIYIKTNQQNRYEQWDGKTYPTKAAAQAKYKKDIKKYQHKTWFKKMNQVNQIRPVSSGNRSANPFGFGDYSSIKFRLPKF